MARRRYPEIDRSFRTQRHTPIHHATAAAFRAIRRIEDEHSRNLVRGAIASCNTRTLAAKAINSLRKITRPADLALSVSILMGQDGPFADPRFTRNYADLRTPHYIDAAQPRSELAFVIGHVNGWTSQVIAILKEIANLLSLHNNPPHEQLDALCAFVDNFGASCFVLRRLSYLMARHQADPRLLPQSQRIATTLAQADCPGPYFSALELMETDRFYLSRASARIQIYRKFVFSDFRQILPLHELVPSPLSVGDLGAYLRRAHSTSIADEIIALLQIIILKRWFKSQHDDLVELLSPPILEALNQITKLQFDHGTLYQDADPKIHDLVYYQRCAAFLEVPGCALFRRSIDALIAPRLMSNIPMDVDFTNSLFPPASMHDLTKALNGFSAPYDYDDIQSSGTFLRTVALVHFINDRDNLRRFTSKSLRTICENTVCLDTLLTEREIETLYTISDETSRPLISVLALALYKSKVRNDDVDFKFRFSLCQTVIAQFHGRLERFIEWLIPNTPNIAEYILSILDRPTLQKLYWIIGSADEADRIRQTLLRTVGRQRHQLAYLIEADRIEAKRKVSKLRQFFDDSRIYVDGLAMKEWLDTNPNAYAQQYIKMIKQDLSTQQHQFPGDTNIATLHETYASIARFDYILIEALKTTFEQFCTNRHFGIESYLVTLPPTSIQGDVDSDGWFYPSGRGERRGLAWSWPLSAAPDPVAG
uniref:Uncharacterized protein n=1 Tax=Rhodopseudomonas palustris (strain DX-1) TaxID=652103 RepID=E6VQ23_RHOPX